MYLQEIVQIVFQWDTELYVVQPLQFQFYLYSIIHTNTHVHTYTPIHMYIIVPFRPSCDVIIKDRHQTVIEQYLCD